MSICSSASSFAFVSGVMYCFWSAILSTFLVLACFIPRVYRPWHVECRESLPHHLGIEIVGPNNIKIILNRAELPTQEYYWTRLLAQPPTSLAVGSSSRVCSVSRSGVIVLEQP